ncbi:bestrophin family protein [Robiginitalea aurantiaca]|uniref:Bestrophin family ion channel n=1 Tax=Robiginitalea aurantiaca TaxID=3056915 RepID=A0ABT7WEC1_9FLAO|nr:bestrophin family ion channel [Robiginitalea aurantiaca]MDM9631267.1 bestrophin family ion channel [Robiginitalea aurantiaca]
MYVKRNMGVIPIILGTWKNLVFFTVWTSFIFYLYYYQGWTFISIAFEPLSVIGIAVSFYLGFKNSQSYDRFWEARKIWGSIVNYSRTWATQVLSLVQESEEDKKILIYRHLAWINALRIQLRRPSTFSMKPRRSFKRIIEVFQEESSLEKVLEPFISEAELKSLESRKNAATHLIKNQALHLEQLLSQKRISEFDKLLLHHLMEEMYNQQGGCERIKNTPFPRQYSYFGTVFAWIFVLLLPFGLLNAFDEEFNSLSGTARIWMELAAISLSVLLSWIFITMDKVGSNSEDPFEGRFNDVAMTAICRTIEIDLKDMLDEESLPEKIAPKNNILY